MFYTITTMADTKEFVRDYTYIAGEADSKISARQMAMQEVKRELLSEIGTHIYSKIEISQNSKGETDFKQEILATTTGFVKVDVLEEKWDGYNFYIKAKMAADPQDILKRIKNLSLNDKENVELKKQLDLSAKAFEELRSEMLALKNALADSTKQKDKQNLALAYANKSRELSINEMFEKGQDYFWGKRGKSKNNHEALKWYQKAADKGHVKAQKDLGMLYWTDIGELGDFELAVFWSKMSAEQGNGDAQFNLSLIYSINKDAKKAFFWGLKAAEKGVIQAYHNVSRWYKEGEGVSQNYEKALFWLKKRAEEDDNPSIQYDLAMMYFNGQGAQQNVELGFLWMEKAAEQNYIEAQYKLSMLYYRRENTEKTLFWLKKAAENDHSDAQFILARKLIDGDGVEQNTEKALYWMKKAAELGHENAVNIIQGL